MYDAVQKGSIDTEDITSYVHYKNQVELEQHRVQKLQQDLEEKNLMIEKLEVINRPYILVPLFINELLQKVSGIAQATVRNRIRSRSSIW